MGRARTPLVVTAGGVLSHADYKPSSTMRYWFIPLGRSTVTISLRLVMWGAEVKYYQPYKKSHVQIIRLFVHVCGGMPRTMVASNTCFSTRAGPMSIEALRFERTQPK